MGLMNAPAVFMKIMNRLFIDILDKGVVLFLDGILIFSNTVEKYLELLKILLTCLCKHAFYYKLKKCGFLQKATTFLGFDITVENMHISDTKVRNCKELPKPITI